MTCDRKFRIGIDVGGTFTHAVAIDAATLELIGKAKVPTTHRAAEGVACGIIESLQKLMAEATIGPNEVVLVAHSTTQATNALLEGDVAPVGVLAIGRGLGGRMARRQTRLADIPLAGARSLHVHHVFLSAAQINPAAIAGAVDRLRAAGAEVIVAAEAFSVDDPTGEELVCRIARERGLPATATHHISQLHGLAMRTRTAVINACMLPKMLATADMTEAAVRRSGITAPLMIMRSDGGVMDVAEMRRRPILTMLSGPAAGVAAALLYACVSDGLFLEVGGTSTDISAIKNGLSPVRSAEVGGHRLFLSTLDVRTLGVAGGSLVGASDGRVIDVGPRSAHIADLGYLCFADASDGSVVASAHREAEDEYLAVEYGQRKLALTPTCAARRLAGDSTDLVGRGFEASASARGFGDGASLAQGVLDRAAERIRPVIDALFREYKLDRKVIRLVGGGGGAETIVPAVAKAMNLPFDIAPNADVISAIGVALALVRDAVERTVVQPSAEDVRAIRAEALESVVRMGANPAGVEVHVEVDAKRNLLRATAQGATDIRRQKLRRVELSEDQRRALVAASIGLSDSPPSRVAGAAGFEVWAAEWTARLWGRWFPRRRLAIRALDAAGSIRWSSSRGDWCASTAAGACADLPRLAERHTRYSDAGATIPRCFALVAGRIINLSGLAEMAFVISVLQMELSALAPDTPCVLLLDLA